jgi:hypothetical protein
MNQHDAEDEQTKREREEESDRDREDRAVILARRQLLIASAMAGIAVTAEGCDWLRDRVGIGGARACLSVAPEPCLEVAPPQACLRMAQPGPCLSTPPEPQVCLSRVVPQPCLEMVAPVEDSGAPTQPGTSSGLGSGQPHAVPCLSQSTRPMACLSRRPPTAPRPQVCLSEELVQKPSGDDDDSE